MENRPDELSREIERLWARLGPSDEPSYAPTAPASAMAGAEVAWETVGLLKRQQRERESVWTRALESKEEALKVFRARAEALEAEVRELRGKLEAGEESLLSDVLDARSRLEAAVKALEAQRAAHDEERRQMQAALDDARTALAAEASRARESERRREKSEQRHLLDLQELRASAERRQREGDVADESVRALKSSLAEAKNALEKTLSELLVERKARTDAEGQRAAAMKKADELQAHFADLQKLWEEERAQWRELWDRERATWEAQRQELAQWEESLRREREAWHADLKTQEQAHLAFTEELARKAREATKPAEAESGEDALARLKAEAAAAAARDAALAASRKRTALIGGGAAAALAVAVLSWTWGRAWSWTAQAEAPAPTANPAAVAFDGTALWTADWNGTLTAADASDPRTVLRRAVPPVPAPYRPTALAFGGGVMWSLDAAQARIVRHEAARPEKVLAVRPSPGAAPTALAWDGEALWSYDAANRSLYRHGGDEKEHAPYALDADVVPNAMAWVGGRLWIADGKSGGIVVLARKDGGLKVVERAAAPVAGLVGLAPAGESGRTRSVFALSGPSAGRPAPALTLWKVRRRLPLTAF